VLCMGPSGFITLLAGWITTEAGRQPWVVYGVMRTADAVSPVTAQQVGVSLLAFVIVYSIVFGTGIYYLLKLLRQGPALPGSHTEVPTLPGGAHRPLGVPGQSIEGA
jgi:cytochrome bd ubiquinol oxidase subunit I